MIGDLAKDLVSLCAIMVFPGASVRFSKYRIRWLVDTQMFNMPSAGIELDDRDKKFKRAIIFGYAE